MAMINFKMKNKDPDNLKLDVVVTDPNAGDPAHNEPFTLEYNAEQPLTAKDLGGKKGVIDWVARATGRDPNVNTDFAVQDGYTYDITAKSLKAKKGDR